MKKIIQIIQTKNGLLALTEDGKIYREVEGWINVYTWEEVECKTI